MITHGMIETAKTYIRHGEFLVQSNLYLIHHGNAEGQHSHKHSNLNKEMKKNLCKKNHVFNKNYILLNEKHDSNEIHRHIRIMQGTDVTSKVSPRYLL